MPAAHNRRNQDAYSFAKAMSKLSLDDGCIRSTVFVAGGLIVL